MLNVKNKKETKRTLHKFTKNKVLKVLNIAALYVCLKRSKWVKKEGRKRQLEYQKNNFLTYKMIYGIIMIIRMIVLV